MTESTRSGHTFWAAPPVVFLVFNRPEQTRQSLAAIRQGRPRRIFVVADGPRPNQPSDAAACAEVRRIVREGIDWDTQASFQFAETNMGLRQRISSGLTWAFEHVEEVLIIEDDCVVQQTLFPYCAELLERYRHDQRVGCINGTNLLPIDFPFEASYCFTRWHNPCGWATWRRAWRLYDAPLQLCERARAAGWFDAWFPNPRHRIYWEHCMQRTYRGRTSSWAYVWWMTCWAHSMLTINPCVNLVRNIGFGLGGTHTANPDDWMAHLPVGEMTFPLRHPDCVITHYQADAFFRDIRGTASLKQIWKTRWKNWWQGVKRHYGLRNFSSDQHL
jgi:hypothetical protein